MNEVAKLPLGGWIFYFSGKEKSLDKHKCGKWMHFFNNKEFAAHICEDAIAKGIWNRNIMMRMRGYTVSI